MTLQRDWETDRRICDAATPPAFRTDLKDKIFINQALKGWPAALEEIARLQALVKELEAGNLSSPTEDTRKPPRGGSSTAPPELVAFKVGDWVEKVTGDYHFSGIVVACFFKRNNTSMRVVVENSDGILHIFSPGNLRKIRD